MNSTTLIDFDSGQLKDTLDCDEIGTVSSGHQSVYGIRNLIQRIMHLVLQFIEMI